MKRALIAALLAWGCAETPAPECPTAERGAWTVVCAGYGIDGKPGLTTTEICADEGSCRATAAAMNASLAENDMQPIYFVTWSEE